ncbi:MAG: DUF4870 domain-containing protein [Bdellovibrio sp.]|nr:DUF4870 domain-containing protein [Methylotenera sp.]
MNTEINTDLTKPSINNPSNDEKNIATITHLAGTVFSFIPPLVVWILKKDDSAYIANQAKEALNFQITVALAMFVCGILIWLVIPIILMMIIWLANIVLCIIAAIACSKGEAYRYPFCLRLIN